MKLMTPKTLKTGFTLAICARLWPLCGRVHKKCMGGVLCMRLLSAPSSKFTVKQGGYTDISVHLRTFEHEIHTFSTANTDTEQEMRGSW